MDDILYRCVFSLDEYHQILDIQYYKNECKKKKKKVKHCFYWENFVLEETFVYSFIYHQAL